MKLQKNKFKNKPLRGSLPWRIRERLWTISEEKNIEISEEQFEEIFSEVKSKGIFGQLVSENIEVAIDRVIFQ